MNLGMGRGLARMTGRRSGRGGAGGGQGGEGAGLASIFLLALVVIGLLRALVVVYKLVNRLAKRMLARAEDYIVDWGQEEQGQPVADEEIRADV